MKLSNIFLVLLVALMFQSCLYTGMSHFTDDDLEWFNCYNVGDSSFFISNFYNIDTLVVTQKRNYDTYNRLIPNEGQSSTFEAIAWYHFNIINDSKSNKDTIDGGLNITKDFETDALVFCAHVGRRYAFDVSKFNRSSKEFNDIFSKFSSFDSIPGNYLIFDDKNSRYSKYWADQENKFTLFVFNKNYGLIYYKYEDGEEFIRKFD